MDHPEPKESNETSTYETNEPQEADSNDWSLVMPVDMVKSIDGNYNYGSPINDTTNYHDHRSDEASSNQGENE